MIHMAAVQFHRYMHVCAGKGAAIFCRQRASLRRAIAKQRQTRSENSCLQLVETAVDAGVDVVVSVSLSAVSETGNAIGQRSVIRNDSAAIAERAEIFRRIETERAGRAKRPNGPPCT